MEVGGARDRVSSGAISKDDGKLLELQAEQTFLAAKELLYQTHYDSLKQKAGDNALAQEELSLAAKQAQSDIDSEQTLNAAAQFDARHDIRAHDLEQEAELLQKKKEFVQAEIEFRRQAISQLTGLMANDWTQTLKNYKEFWGQASVVQKIALVAQKAYALAEIGIQLARQITMINTAATLMDAVVPFSGEPFRVKGLIKAIGSAALQTASVLAVSPSIPTFEFGGYTNPNAATPSGYTSGATHYTKRNFIAGEAGTEFIMSAPMLGNPVMADLAAAMNALQVSGDYKKLSYSSSPAGGTSSQASAPAGGSDALLMQILLQLQNNQASMDNYAQRPVSFDTQLFRKNEQYNTQIDLDNRL